MKEVTLITFTYYLPIYDPLKFLINFHLSLVMLFMTDKKLKESSWRQVESMLQCFNSKKEEEEEEEYYYIHSGVRRRVELAGTALKENEF